MSFIQTSGVTFTEFTEMLGRQAAGLGKPMNQAASQAGQMIVFEAKRRTPVVGRHAKEKKSSRRSLGLKKSWGFKLVELSKHFGWMVIAGARRDKPFNVWYFHMVEEGHEMKTKDGGTHARVIGRHYLRRAVRATTRRLKLRIDRIFEGYFQDTI